MLTNNQENFCQLVAAGKTYADAYKEAYPVSINWKQNAVYVQSSILMSNSNIIVRVKELQEENKKRNQVTLDEVLEEMAAWLRFNIKTIFNTDGTMKQIHEMTNQEAACIASYENVELFDGSGDKKVHIGYIRKVKLIDKRSTADMFMRRFGEFITNVKIDNEDMSHLKDLLKDIKY